MNEGHAFCSCGHFIFQNAFPTGFLPFPMGIIFYRWLKALSHGLDQNGARPHEPIFQWSPWEEAFTSHFWFSLPSLSRLTLDLAFLMVCSFALFGASNKCYTFTNKQTNKQKSTIIKDS